MKLKAISNFDYYGTAVKQGTVVELDVTQEEADRLVSIQAVEFTEEDVTQPEDIPAATAVDTGWQENQTGAAVPPAGVDSIQQQSADTQTDEGSDSSTPPFNPSDQAGDASQQSQPAAPVVPNGLPLSHEQLEHLNDQPGQQSSSNDLPRI